MRKTMATVIVLGLVWIGYTMWPLYDLFVLVRANASFEAQTSMEPRYFFGEQFEIRNDTIETVEKCTTATPRSSSARNTARSVLASIGLPVRSDTMSWQILSCGKPKPAALSTISRSLAVGA